MGGMDRRSRSLQGHDQGEEGCMRRIKPHTIRACARKRNFGSRDHAQQVANELNKTVGTNLKVYQCDACKHWHLAKRRVKVRL